MTVLQKSCSHVSLAPEEVSSIGFNKDHSCLADIFVPNGSLYLSATFDLKVQWQAIKMTKLVLTGNGSAFPYL